LGGLSPFGMVISFRLAMHKRLHSLPWRPVPFALVLGAGLALLATRQNVGLPRTTAVERALAETGLVASDIAWIDPPPHGPFGSFSSAARALVRAQKPGEPSDIFLVRAKLTAEGNLLGIVSVSNLTHTPLADESAPLVDGEQVVYSAAVEGVNTSIFALDLAEQSSKAEDITLPMRMQIAVTNYQETGQLAGIAHRGWTFDPSPSSLRVELARDAIEVDADGRRIRLPRQGSEPLEGGEFVRAHSAALARPGNFITWAVDRVRAMSWFGDDRMQFVKALAFTVEDSLSRWGRLFVTDTSAKDIASDMGQVGAPVVTTYTDPDTGWPPPPMDPIITPALPGEGAWVPLDKDLFVLTNPGAPAAFMTSFIRTDRERLYTRVYVGLWDPRQVELHMMAGTVEPIGASGEAGPGLIPRTPEVMRRVVAAMNGGFQAMHGEFGMMGDGVVYLPPKPYAATVAELRDGSTAFGEWPADDSVPDFILSYRQNLTVLVKDEKFNPYGRTWWGGTPPGQTDKIHTVRSGICLTRENFVAYFYGAETAADVLAQAMIRARCKFGIHLDMNAGHTGLEFYRVAPTAELAPLSRPLQPDWEAEGTVPGLDGWRFRGRRMIRHMGLMNFPRYIHREGRDFFYLTLRHVLPGADVPSASADDGHWRTRGLPQHGFPFAMATTAVHPDAGRADFRVDLLKLDPRVLAVMGTAAADGGAPTVAVFSNIARTGAHRPRLWLTNDAFSIATEAPAGAVELWSGISMADPGASNASAAVGVSDEDGTLLYAESTAAPDAAKQIDALLARLGCSNRMILAHALSPALGGTITLEGDAAKPSDGPTVRLVRREIKSASTIFDDTPVVPPEVWQPLQMRRVRYFRKPAPPTPAPASSISAPSVPPSVTPDSNARSAPPPTEPIDPFAPN
jgi:hypothetical protein